MNELNEEWRPCPIYGDSYMVSNTGKVKNASSGSLVSPQTDHKGYLRVRLSHKNKKASGRIHRLVAIAFLPNPERKPQVNHIDGDKTNNNIRNLEWVTNSENQKHAYRNGLNRVTGRAGRKKVGVVQLDACGHEVHRYCSINEAARATGIQSVNIGKVASGERKTAGGYRWEVVKDAETQ